MSACHCTYCLEPQRLLARIRNTTMPSPDQSRPPAAQPVQDTPAVLAAQEVQRIQARLISLGLDLDASPAGQQALGRLTDYLITLFSDNRRPAPPSSPISMTDGYSATTELYAMRHSEPAPPSVDREHRWQHDKTLQKIACMDCGISGWDWSVDRIRDLEAELAQVWQQRDQYLAERNEARALLKRLGQFHD